MAEFFKKVGNGALKGDAYGPSFNFWMPGGRQSNNTYCGLCMTVLLVICLIFYGTVMAHKLFAFDETDIMISSRDAFFDTDFEFSEDLMYAFGITAYDSNREPIEDPSYGVLKPYYKSWGIKAGIGGVDWEPLPTKECNEAMLHVNGQSDPDSAFYKPHKNSAADLGFYYKKLKCLDVEAIKVQGDFNSPRTRSFTLLFEKCE